ncbi:hypothetical protein ACEWY4_012145 [Coilia grayii]|uniref:C2 domain-containing protein n=1 Tax=Coilia grayii TaxID=363190 RepID=A0ABD1JZQ6_9TELE
MVKTSLRNSHLEPGPVQRNIEQRPEWRNTELTYMRRNPEVALMRKTAERCSMREMAEPAPVRKTLERGATRSGTKENVDPLPVKENRARVPIKGTTEPSPSHKKADPALRKKKRKIHPSGFKGQLKLLVSPEDGRLSVHVMEARGLLGKRYRPCDSYVKLSVVPDVDHTRRWRTRTILDCKSPTFNETFVLELGAEDHHKRLLVSMWNRSRTSRRSDLLGCMSFGVYSLITAQKDIHGWYYLLGEELGRSKHLKVAARRIKRPADESFRRLPGETPPPAPYPLPLPSPHRTPPCPTAPTDRTPSGSAFLGCSLCAVTVPHGWPTIQSRLTVSSLHGDVCAELAGL